MQELGRRVRKWITGFLSIYLDKRLKVRRKRRPIDVFLIDKLMTRLLKISSPQQFTHDESQEYAQQTRNTVYWHGTGKLQYKDGEVIDVLKEMLKAGGINPAKDLFDFKHGEMRSISLARQRMYGRIYADMHEYKGVDLSTRYGSPSFWVYYFIIAINIHSTKELKLWNPIVRRKKHNEWRQLAKETWTIKITRNPGKRSGLFFTNGSDIVDNFPILIGIKGGDYEILKTAEYIARYETRVGSVISLKNFTHLEVPENRIDEVKAMLKKYGYEKIHVFAIEKVEQFYSNKHFSELVS